MPIKAILPALLIFCASYASAQSIEIISDRLIVDARKPALGASTIEVADGKIVTIHSGIKSARDGVKQIDLRGKTVMPGLIDSHVHLTSDAEKHWTDTVTVPPEYRAIVGVKNAALTVRAGFTTVRDLGSSAQSGYALRNAINKGVVIGPRMLVSGSSVSIVGGHGDITGFRPEVIHALGSQTTCTGADQCSLRVRELSRLGADVIKIAATGGVNSQQNRGMEQHFTDAELKSIIHTANLLGLKTAAHAHGPRGVEAVAKAGVTSIEHGTFVDVQSIKVMKEMGTYLVPTLSPTIAYRELMDTGQYTEVVKVKIAYRLSVTGDNIRAAQKAGIAIAFGTDAGVSEHGRNAEEFPLMMQYGGMSEQQCLIAATVTAAKLLGVDGETGTLEAGKAADIIALDGNPLEDIAATSKVSFVMARGKVVRE